MDSSPPDLMLIEHHAEWWRLGTTCIAGIIRNIGRRRYTHVQVSVHLYDDTGNQVGSTRDTVDNLEPGGVWGFRIPVHTPEARVASYTIAELSGV